MDNDGNLYSEEVQEVVLDNELLIQNLSFPTGNGIEFIYQHWTFYDLIKKKRLKAKDVVFKLLKEFIFFKLM